MNVSKACDYLKLNNFTYYKVLKGNAVCFRSPESEEEASKANVDDAIAHFQTNISMYPAGSYTLLGQKNMKATASAGTFYFSVEGDGASKQVSGVSTERVEELINAKMQAVQQEYEKRFEQLKHENELKERDKQIADLKKQLKEKPALGIDKFQQVISGISDILNKSQGLQAAKPATPAVTASVPGSVAGSPETTTQTQADQNTEPEPQAIITDSLQRLHSALGDEDLVSGLQGLAQIAEDEPEKLRMYLNMLKG